MCLYLLLEAVSDTRTEGKARVHPHRGMMIAVMLTLITAAAILFERGY